MFSLQPTNQPSKNIFFTPPQWEQWFLFHFISYCYLFYFFIDSCCLLLSACHPIPTPKHSKTELFILNMAHNALETTMHAVSNWDLLRMWSSRDYKFRLPPKIAKARYDEANVREKKLIICWMLLALIDMKNDELNTQRTTIDLLCSTKSSKYVC